MTFPANSNCLEIAEKLLKMAFFGSGQKVLHCDKNGIFDNDLTDFEVTYLVSEDAVNLSAR